MGAYESWEEQARAQHEIIRELEAKLADVEAALTLSKAATDTQRWRADAAEAKVERLTEERDDFRLSYEDAGQRIVEIDATVAKERQGAKELLQALHVKIHEWHVHGRRDPTWKLCAEDLLDLIGSYEP